MGASLAAFAQHVQADMEDLRGEVATVRFEAAETTARVMRMEGATTSAAEMARQAAADAAHTRTVLDDLAAKVERLTASGPSPAGRTGGRMGNL